MAGFASRTAATIVGAMALAVGSSAQADVKAGVTAWEAGDYAAAVKEWADPAAKGDPEAQFNLAQAYRLGQGVSVDLKQAELLYARAAAKGHVRAADNYGLMLYQEGRLQQAMPYVEAASDRGDPRAQYLMGIAHFNGNPVPKDWRRAYALTSLAHEAGLPQARPALDQMDEYIPLPERQAAQALMVTLRVKAEAARKLALATVASDPVPPQVKAAAAKPAAVQPLAASTAKPKPVAVAATGGAWKLQLGAFGVAGNVDRLWAKLAKIPALDGATKLTEPEGRLTKLLAGGFPNQATAQRACTSLKAAGYTCLVTR